MDFVKHMQIDILNLNKEIHSLKKTNLELNEKLKKYEDTLLKNIEKGVLFFLGDCDKCDGSGHFWEGDSCKCCDDPMDCSKCKGKGEYWSKLCG